MTDISVKCREIAMKEQFEMDKRLLEQENSLPEFLLGQKYIYFFEFTDRLYDKSLIFQSVQIAADDQYLSERPSDC